MKKKIFLGGKVYDLSTITVQEIIDDVQSRLDTYYGKNRIRFTLNVDKQAKEVIINFWRSYNEWYHPKKTNNIFCADIDLLSGRGIDGFTVPCM